MTHNQKTQFSTSDIQQCLALAGVCQSAALVKQVSKHGRCDEAAFRATIESIVITEPENTEQVYGEKANLRIGFDMLYAQLANHSTPKDTEITRYIANLLSIERKLHRTSRRMNELGDRINHIKRQQQHLDLFSGQMLSNLASVYSDVVSPVTAKIQVAGDPQLLKQSDNQHKVRALLLAGVRSAVLWRQLGGKRRHILFKRQRILACVEHVLAHINQSR